MNIFKLEKRQILFSIAIGIIVISIITLALSFWTIDDEKKNVEIYYGECSKVNVPFRFTAEDGLVEYECGWSFLRTFSRLLYIIIYLISSGVYYYSIKNKSTKFFLISLLAMLVAGIIGFYSFIGDASAAASGSSFCRNKISYDGGAYECENGRYFGIVGLNAIIFISIFVLFGLSLFSRSKLFNTLTPSSGYATQNDTI